MTTDKILIADHESKSIYLLRQILNSAGYEVISTNRTERALQLATEEHPALVVCESALLDGSDEYALIRRLREYSDIPVIILSSRDGIEDILNGFEAGADDFLAKPYDARILLARVKALLFRCKNSPSTPEIIHCGNLTINQGSRQVTMNDVPVYLTETEYNLLLELAKHADQVMLHEQLLRTVWGPEYRHELDYLRSYVHILRKKLETTPSKPSLIVSLSGIGYKLVSNSPASKGK